MHLPEAEGCVHLGTCGWRLCMYVYLWLGAVYTGVSVARVCVQKCVWLGTVYSCMPVVGSCVHMCAYGWRLYTHVCLWLGTLYVSVLLLEAVCMQMCNKSYLKYVDRQIQSVAKKDHKLIRCFPV